MIRSAKLLFTSLCLACLACLALINPATAGNSGQWIDLTIETDEVTWPDMAITPDGEKLVFPLLGHLVQIPVAGGAATQLTFGRGYDGRPAVSPDGKRIVFQSDRDGSEGNIFVLDLDSGEVTQATFEAWADVPVWSPDGSELVFVSFDRQSWQPWGPILLGPPVGVIKKVNLASGHTTALTETPADVRSPFFMTDGRLAWAVVDRQPFAVGVSTRIEVLGDKGNTTTLKTVDAYVDSIVPAPDGSGLYARRYKRADFLYNYRKEQDIVLIPLGEQGPVQVVSPVSGEGMFSHHEPSIALSPDGGTLYAGNFGKVFQIKPPSGLRVPVPFTAKISRAVRKRIEPPRWQPIEVGTVSRPRSLEDPQIAADGSHIAFRSAGRVWLQSLPDGKAIRVESGLAFDPVFSPDSNQLAYIAGKPAEERGDSENTDLEIRIYTLSSGDTRTLVAGSGCPFEHLNWVEPHRLVAQGCEQQAVSINAKNGAITDLVDTEGPENSPQITSAGDTLYYVDKGAFPIFSHGNARRVALDGDSEPELLFPILTSAIIRVSADGQWIAMPANTAPGLMVARLADKPQSAADFDLVDSGVFTEFNFTPDNKAIIYVANGKLWRKTLGGTPGGSDREEIPVNLHIQTPTPAPVLITNTRILDFNDGGYSKAASILIENGRIKKIGRIGKRSLPEGTEVVNANGRYAIPGLIEGHGHLGGCGNAEYLAYGVTTVRNMGGGLVQGNAQADQGDLMGDAVSRCFTSGPIFEGEQGRVGVGLFVQPGNEQEARRWVRQWQDNGADFVKFYWIMPSNLHRAAVDEAHRLGLPVYSHGITLDETVRGMIHGYSGFTHLGRHLHDDLLSMLHQTGSVFDTTLGVMGFEWTQRSQPERIPCHTGGLFYRGLADDILRGKWLDVLASAREAHERGIPLFPGTDYSPSGNALHLELEFYQDAGIAPIDIIQSATLDVAAAMGAEQQLGSIEVGKLADIVLLDADPLETLSNARSVWRTIKGGKIFDPQELGFTPASLYRPDFCEAQGGISVHKSH